MLYRVESDKSFDEVAFDLEPIVQRLGFVVLQRLDMGELLRRQGADYDEDWAVFQLGHAKLTASLLECAPALAPELPPSITVHTDNGATWITARTPLAADCEQAQPACAALTQRVREIVNKAR